MREAGVPMSWVRPLKFADARRCALTDFVSSEMLWLRRSPWRLAAWRRGRWCHRFPRRRHVRHAVDGGWTSSFSRLLGLLPTLAVEALPKISPCPSEDLRHCERHRQHGVVDEGEDGGDAEEKERDGAVQGHRSVFQRPLEVQGRGAETPCGGDEDGEHAHRHRLLDDDLPDRLDRFRDHLLGIFHANSFHIISELLPYPVLG